MIRQTVNKYQFTSKEGQDTEGHQHYKQYRATLKYKGKYARIKCHFIVPKLHIFPKGHIQMIHVTLLRELSVEYIEYKFLTSISRFCSSQMVQAILVTSPPRYLIS